MLHISKLTRCLVGLALLGIVILTGCQPQAAEPPSEPTTVSTEPTSMPEPTTLSVWWISSSPEYADTVTDILATYMAENPNITVETTFFSYSDYVAAMGPALESGNPPDLAFSDPFPPTLPNYIDAGHVMELSDVASDRGWADLLAPGMLEFYSPVHRGGIYGPPLNPALRGFFYNKQIMEEIGGQVPETIADLEALAASAKDAGYVPFGLGNQTFWSSEYYWLNMFYQNLAGGDWEAFKEGVMTCTPGVSWSGPEITEALERFVQWEQAGYFNEGYNGIGETDVHLEFARGNMLTYYYNAASQNTALLGDELDFEVGFFNFPLMAAGDPNLEMTDPGNVLIVPTGSAHPTEAIDLIDWLLQPAVGQMFAEAGIVPAHRVDLSGVELPVPWMAEELNSLAEQIPYNWLNWSVPGLGDVTGPEVQRLLAGEITVQEAVDSFQETYDEACGG